MLLALNINSLESIQAFIFYLVQYIICNLNAFVILICIGFSLYPFVYAGNLKDCIKILLDRNNSPIQLISQLKGYFHVNSTLALSLAITLFSFVGVPPLIGFFAKQMVLSAALDSGYIFLSLVAILTSVISAVYYLGVIKEVFFDRNDFKSNEGFANKTFSCTITSVIPYTIASIIPYTIASVIPYMYYINVKFTNYINVIYTNYINVKLTNNIYYTIENVTISNYLSVTISILTLILLCFIFICQE
jgi:NADH:ubiquinone oxidoreductase subunit 2 (subunit N)